MMDVVVVTAENIEDAKYGMPLDQAEELRPGCITWPIFDSNGNRGQITIWPDTGRGAVCWGGNSFWGDWYDDSRVIVLDETAKDGSMILVHEDGEEEIVDQPWW